MKIYNELKQGTPEWLAVRLGKFTASDAQAISASGAGLQTLVFEKVAEIMTQKINENGFKSADMERGHELEAMARNAYELEKGIVTTQVGFIELNERVGASPDSLAGEDGLVEIKCINDSKFVKFMLDNKMDTAHEWQMQMQLLVTGRKWVDYVLFNPSFPNPVIITRVLRDEAKIKKIEIGIENGKKQLAEILKVVQTR